MNIEPLEFRIAPASVFVTYTDVDGDLVKITGTRAGTIAPPLDPADLVFVSGGASGQLARLNLTDPAFGDVSIVFTVTKKTGGDGLAHVGFIDATGVDLDRVVVRGDLGKIVAGESATTTDPGLNLLQVRTMGTLGLVTQGGTGDLDSTIMGKLGALKVAGDFTDASIFVTIPGGGNPADAAIGSIFIGGDVTGGAENGHGAIQSLGPIGAVTIGGDLNGGSGSNSGVITCAISMGNVRVGGSVVGGAGALSGVIRCNGTIASVQIGGDLTFGAGAGAGQVDSSGAMGPVRIGGVVSGEVSSDASIGNVKIGRDFSGRLDAGSNIGNVQIGGDVHGVARGGTGQIQASGKIGNISIGGDFIGGTANATGIISGNQGIGHVRIAGDFIGGSIRNDESLSNAGGIQSSGLIASVTIGGSLIAGTDDSTGALAFCGAISAGTLGPLKIGASILGNRENPVFIAAEGQDVKPTSGFDTAIASVTVGGDVRFASILAGFVGTTVLFPANADASIGAVKVGRDWVASNLVAGAQDSGDPGFGIDDTLQAAGNTSLIARIASIAIKGDATGSLESGDHFGFVAQQIDKLRIGLRTFVLNAGPSNDNVAIPFTDDLRLLEV